MKRGRHTEQQVVFIPKQAKLDNVGDHQSVGGGVYEMRLHFGAGYRLYYAQEGEFIYLLISGGNKSSQSKDVERAIAIWREVNKE